MPLTVYVPTTIYQTRLNTAYEVTRLRVTSNYVTQIDYDYRDPETGGIYTRISIPTKIFKGVTTEIIGIERRTPQKTTTETYETYETRARKTPIPI